MAYWYTGSAFFQIPQSYLYLFAAKLYFIFLAAKLYFIFLCMATEHTLCDHNTTHQTLV